MDRKLLDILCCPTTKQPLAQASQGELDAVNAAITAGGVVRADGSAQVGTLKEALVTPDPKTTYPVEDGIPAPLAEEATYGRVSALRARGREADERLAIARFLEIFPESPIAATHRARLRSLGPR